MKCANENKKLDNLLGKNVKIVFTNNLTLCGKLRQNAWDSTKYSIDCGHSDKVVFRKSSIKSVEII